MTPPETEQARAIVEGNLYDKYRTRNPVARRLQRGFLRSASGLLEGLDPGRVLEVGCGPGDLSEHLPLPTDGYLGTDLSLREVLSARRSYPQRAYFPASVYRLPFADRSFDTVVCCEVLEHLEDPRTAVAEIARVCRRRALFSVPWEPVWRLLNLLRGAYVRQLGNTPGHLQHFARRAIERVVSTEFEVVDMRRPLPWTMLLAEVRERPRVTGGEMDAGGVG